MLACSGQGSPRRWNGSQEAVVCCSAVGEWRSGEGRMGAATTQWTSQPPRSRPGASCNGLFYFPSFPFSLSCLFLIFPLLEPHTVSLALSFNVEENTGMKIHYSNSNVYVPRKIWGCSGKRWPRGGATMLSCALQGGS